MDDAPEEARVAPATGKAHLPEWEVDAPGQQGAARETEAGPADDPSGGVPICAQPGASAGSVSGSDKPARKRHRRRRRKKAGATGDAVPAPEAQSRPALRKAEGGKASKKGGHVYAAVDLGTNNCRLLVARPGPDGFQVVDAFSRIVRLGEGLAQNRHLGDEAMDRAVSALRVCASKMRRQNVTRARLVATEACRKADNSEAFLRRVERDVGISLDIVTAEEEARLAVLGCAPLLDPDAKRALVFDIGGGSTELVWLDTSSKDAEPELLAWASLPVGVVSLTDRYGNAWTGADGFRAMVAEVSALLEAREWPDHVAEDIAKGDVHLLGTSGTVTTLAGIHLGLRRYDRSRVDGAWIDFADVAAVTRSLAGMTVDERAGVPCVGRERADLVLAGCAILEAIHAMWPCKRLRVADRGLREGILLTLMGEDQKKKRKRKRRRRRRRGGNKVETAST